MVHRVQPLDLMSFTWKRRLSILIANWWVFELKVKKTKVEYIMSIDIEIAVCSVLVTKDRKMPTRRWETAIFHWAAVILNQEWRHFCPN